MFDGFRQVALAGECGAEQVPRLGVARLDREHILRSPLRSGGLSRPQRCGGAMEFCRDVHGSHYGAALWMRHTWGARKDDGVRRV